MCDGTTEGRDGMELSLFGRDVIAMSTGIALSHDVFEAAIMLGVCDKGSAGVADRCAELRTPAHDLRQGGPMTSGLANTEKAKLRQAYAEGTVERAALLDANASACPDVGKLHVLPGRRTPISCSGRSWARTYPARRSPTRAHRCERRSPRDGDLITLDCTSGTLHLHVDANE